MDKVWGELKKCFYMGRVVDIGSVILGNGEVLLREGKGGIEEYVEKDCFVEMIGVKYGEIVVGKLRRDSKKMRGGVKNKVSVGIEEVRVGVMWMMDFGVG
ncbi:hypothetical protein ACRFB9_28350 [Klebsiella pneumoniae]